MDRYEVEVRNAGRPGPGDRLLQPGGEPGGHELQFGMLHFPVKPAAAAEDTAPLLTIDAARHDVSFPSGIRLNADGQSTGHTRVGPLIGVLTSGHLSRGPVSRRSPFAYQSYLIRHLAETARRMRAFVFAFEPVGVDWESGRIGGWTCIDGRWREVRMPFPDAVYNRVPNRWLESQSGVQRTLAGLRHNSVPVFNPRFIDKSQLYECLRADPAVSHYLPETTPLRHHGQVVLSLNESPIVYLKPRFGSLGNGIVRVERTDGNVARVRFRRNGRNYSRLIPYRSLPEFVAGLMRERDYVCQQGIDLPLFRGHPFDVRILTQKDGHGEWRLTGMGVRVAGEGSITTHVPSGGSIAPIGRVLLTVFGGNAGRVASDLRSAIAAIAPAIERGLNQGFGEFSMDLGVDRRGNIWFFEANSKPHKFDEDEIRLLSWERTIEFAGYLGGFPGLGR